MSAVYAVRSPDVVHETIDGETVIVDMTFGTYYRLEGAAAVAWPALATGASAADLGALLVATFDATEAEIEKAVAEFLAALQGCQLIAPAAKAGVPEPVAGVAAKRAFPGMAVHRFSDFQELFFIDPVHEVDETGWPTQPAPR